MPMGAFFKLLQRNMADTSGKRTITPHKRDNWEKENATLGFLKDKTITSLQKYLFHTTSKSRGGAKSIWMDR